MSLILLRFLYFFMSLNYKCDVLSIWNFLRDDVYFLSGQTRLSQEINHISDVVEPENHL